MKWSNNYIGKEVILGGSKRVGLPSSYDGTIGTITRVKRTEEFHVVVEVMTPFRNFPYNYYLNDLKFATQIIKII